MFPPVIPFNHKFTSSWDETGSFYINKNTSEMVLAKGATPNVYGLATLALYRVCNKTKLLYLIVLGSNDVHDYLGWWEQSSNWEAFS